LAQPPEPDFIFEHCESSRQARVAQTCTSCQNWGQTDTALFFVPPCATAPTDGQPRPLLSRKDHLSWGPSACHERLSHCIGNHPTRFMSLASRSLLGSGCSCRLKTPGQGNHGVLAPPTLTLSDSRPKPAFLFYVYLHRNLLVVMPTTKVMESASREAGRAPAIPVEVLYCCAAYSDSPEVTLNTW